MDRPSVLQTGFLGTGGNTLVGVADLDDDGNDDLIFANAAGTLMRLDLMNGTTSTSRGFVGNGGGTYAVNVVGDFNGDRKADIGSTGETLRFALLDGAASVAFRFLASGTFVLRSAGDLSGDGTTDIVSQGGANLRLNLMDGGTNTTVFLGSSPGAEIFPQAPDGNRPDRSPSRRPTLSRPARPPRRRRGRAASP